MCLRISAWCTGRKRRHGNKPAWAMTEDRARAAEAAAEQREEEDLLGFAASLDYDAYLDDLHDADLKSALQVHSIPQVAFVDGGS